MKKKYLLLLLTILNFSYADIATNVINKNIKDFEEQKKNERIEENKVYEMKLIEVSKDIKNQGILNSDIYKFGAKSSIKMVEKTEVV